MSAPDIAVIVGSESDIKIVEESELPTFFDKVGVLWELSVISAHRNNQALTDYCLQRRDTKVFIGIAGMAAALPGTIASIFESEKIVIGVPLLSEAFDGLDALLSMVRMPPGVPVLVPGIGKPGLRNAAIAACQIVALTDANVLHAFLFTLQQIRNLKKPQIGILGSKSQ